MPHEFDDQPIRRQPARDGDRDDPATAQRTTTPGRAVTLLAVAAILPVVVGLAAHDPSETTDTPAPVTERIDHQAAESDGYTGDWKDAFIESERRRCQAALQHVDPYSGDWKDALIASELDC